MEERNEMSRSYYMKLVLTIEGGADDPTSNFEAVRQVREWLQSSSPVEDRAIDFEVVSGTPVALLDNTLTGDMADRSYWAYCTIHHQPCDLPGWRQKEIEDELLRPLTQYNFRSREELLEWECRDPDSGIDLKLGKRLYENVKAYRFRNWREYRLHVWGTAYNSFDNGELGYDCIVFKTRDSVPQRIFETISRRYPEMMFTVVYAQEGNRNSAGGYRYQGGKQVSETSFTESGWNFIMERLTPEREYNLQDNIIARLTYALTKGQFSHRRDFGILMNGFPSGLAAEPDRGRAADRGAGTPGLKSTPFTNFARKDAEVESAPNGQKPVAEPKQASESKPVAESKQVTEPERKEGERKAPEKKTPEIKTETRETALPNRKEAVRKEDEAPKKSHGLMNRFLDMFVSSPKAPEQDMAGSKEAPLTKPRTPLA